MSGAQERKPAEQNNQWCRYDDLLFFFNFFKLNLMKSKHRETHSNQIDAYLVTHSSRQHDYYQADDYGSTEALLCRDYCLGNVSK